MQLFYLVFGESVLNDSICVTLFRLASAYVGSESISSDTLPLALLDFVKVFLGSMAIGGGLGLLSAWGLKWCDTRRHRLILVAFFVCTVYAPFLLRCTYKHTHTHTHMHSL